MTIRVSRGTSDQTMETIRTALQGYETDHPQAQIELYRQNPVSVRIRIVDPSFRGLDKPERHELVWRYLQAMPEEALEDLSMLLLLSPEETKQSFANFEFDDPIPSHL